MMYADAESAAGTVQDLSAYADSLLALTASVSADLRRLELQTSCGALERLQKLLRPTVEEDRTEQRGLPLRHGSDEAVQGHHLRDRAQAALPRINHCAQLLHSVYHASLQRSQRMEQQLAQLASRVQQEHAALAVAKSHVRAPQRIRWISIFLFLVWPTLVACLWPLAHTMRFLRQLRLVLFLRHR